jgi:hypothetical protein
MAAEGPLSREAELISRGWTKRSTHEEPRLSETAAAYEELGFEVLIEPFQPWEATGCSDCMAASVEKHRTIYTRKKPDADQEQHRGENRPKAHDGQTS